MDMNTSVNDNETKSTMNVFEICLAKGYVTMHALVAANTKVEACALLWGQHYDYICDFDGCMYFERFCDVCDCTQKAYTVNIACPLVLMYEYHDM